MNIKTVFCALVCGAGVFADIPLIGNNLPHASLLDGDFEEVKAGWRNPGPSPYWTTSLSGDGWGKAGFAQGSMMNTGKERAVFESVVLDQNIQSLEVGDVLQWRFSSSTEYPCDGRVSLALVFGDQEQKVASRVKVPNGPAEPQVYEGFYCVTETDAEAGMPRLKFTLESTHGILVYVHWVDLKVMSSEPIQLAANAVDAGIELSWDQSVGLDRRASLGQPGGLTLPLPTIYKSENERSGFEEVATGVEGSCWTDETIINGKEYFYALKSGDSISNVSKVRKLDSVPPAAPLDLKAFGEDWVIKLYWKTKDNDIEYYKVYRDRVCIAPRVSGVSFEDMLPVKGVKNHYAVVAVDYCGNESPRSGTSSATVKMVRGASFSDLLLPMPIHKELRNDVWGADNVRPRDPDNGIEDSFWSYWGGKAVFENGQYHLNVVRWPENHRKGHWAWPESTVAYAVADQPTGPYEVVRDRAYDFKKGLGHNTNIIPLNDGTFAMYSLIDWKAMILTADSMSGPWTVLGEMQVKVPENYKNAYRLERNLSGVQCEDGSFLVVTKAGAVMRSTEGILGPYEVVSGTTDENPTIPEKYRRSNYEDPVMWYDGVQYHMLINAFLDYRAIYLRSPDGIEWTYDSGLAYTPSCTQYEDGTRTFWYKVERPNVIQDEFGRATHLQLAAVDVPKAEDYGGDRHSSKHLIIPLTVYKRMTVLEQENGRVRLLVYSEDGFDARSDLDLESLRFGGAEAVNYGGGSKVWKTAPHDDGLVLIFEGESGLTEQDFVAKLIGQTVSGELVTGYARLSAE